MPDYYTFQPVQMNRNILQSLVPAQMGKTVTLCDNTATRIRTKYGLGNVPGWVNGVLHDLWVTAKVKSLPEVKLPIFTDEDNSTDRLNKTLLYEWGTARLELEFLLGDSQGNWASFGETAIKNSNGYRYRRHRGIDLITDSPGYQLEENFKIACRLVNVGFGDLTSNDKIDLTGCWVQEFVAVQPQPVYVTNNVYGSTGAATPSPTPTPEVVPTFVLSLPQGKTSASAPASDQIILTVTGVTAGASFSASWYKDTTDTQISESLTMTQGGIILLDSNKLLASGAGNYKLKVRYNSTDYITNTVAVTVPPQVSLAIASTSSNDLTFFVMNGQTYELNIQGSNFTPGSATFAWYKDGSPATRSDSPNVNTPITGTLTVLNNGTFTLNRSQSSANFIGSYDSANKSGFYKIKITQGDVTVESNTIYGQQDNPSVDFTPTSASIAGNTSIAVVIFGFAVGDSLTISWVKDNVEISASATQHTYSKNGGSAFTGYYYTFNVNSSIFGATPYNGAGTYKLRMSKNNTPAKFVGTTTLTITA